MNASAPPKHFKPQTSRQRRQVLASINRIERATQREEIAQVQTIAPLTGKERTALRSELKSHITPTSEGTRTARAIARLPLADLDEQHISRRGTRPTISAKNKPDFNPKEMQFRSLDDLSDKERDLLVSRRILPYTEKPGHPTHIDPLVPQAHDNFAHTAGELAPLQRQVARAEAQRKAIADRWAKGRAEALTTDPLRLDCSLPTITNVEGLRRVNTTEPKVHEPKAHPRTSARSARRQPPPKRPSPWITAGLAVALATSIGLWVYLSYPGLIAP